MLGFPLSNNDPLKIRFSNLSLSASKLLDFHPRSSFFFVMRKRHAHIADGMKYHSNWYRNRIMGYCRKNKCHNDDIITITTTWSPKIALVLGNYIVNQVGNLCRGHPDKRIKSSCKEEILKYVSDCIFKKFWDISWNFPAGFHHHIGLHHINIQLGVRSENSFFFHTEIRQSDLNQWIGLRENLQETIDFPIKYGAFL